MDHVVAAVLRYILAERGHPWAEQILRADDQSKLLARIEHQTDWQQIDFDLNDRAGVEFLDAVEAVHRDFVRRQRLIQVSHRHAQTAGGTLVPQD
jgi:hypothetical protein